MPTLTLYDYLPSQNGWKVRLLLAHLGLPYTHVLLNIFDGEAQTESYLAMKPNGGVPVLEIAPGQALAESNAILAYLAEATPYLASDPLQRAQTLAWLFFESEMVDPNIGSLRFWTLTGKLPQRATALIELKRAGGTRALVALQRYLQDRDYLVGTRYSIADISLYAYIHLADDAGFALAQYPAVIAWQQRVRDTIGDLAPVYDYSIDPLASREIR